MCTCLSHTYRHTHTLIHCMHSFDFCSFYYSLTLPCLVTYCCDSFDFFACFDQFVSHFVWCAFYCGCWNFFIVILIKYACVCVCVRAAFEFSRRLKAIATVVLMLLLFILVCCAKIFPEWEFADANAKRHRKKHVWKCCPFLHWMPCTHTVWTFPNIHTRIGFAMIAQCVSVSHRFFDNFIILFWLFFGCLFVVRWFVAHCRRLNHAHSKCNAINTTDIDTFHNRIILRYHPTKVHILLPLVDYVLYLK